MRFLAVSRPYASDPETDRSLRHSVRDGVAYSVMSGGGESYFSAFALFLRASTAQIALLASLPPLLGSLAQLFSAWMGRRTGRRRGLILAGAWLQALSLIPLALLPVAFPDYAVPILILSVVLYYAGANFALPQWGSLMGDLVPHRRRGRFFALRTRYASMASFLALVTAGLVLHFFDGRGLTIGGYWVIFGVALVARIVSIHHLARMHDPPGHTAAMEIPVGRGWWQRIHHSPFARFSLFFGLMQFSVAIASPFFTVYLLRDLGVSYMEFMACTASTVVLQFLTLNSWGRVGDIFGNRLVLTVTGFMIPCLPLLWLVSTEIWYLMLIQGIGGLAWAGFSLSAGNFLYDLVPAAKRATYLALHNVFASAGVFVGAMLGGFLGTALPDHWTFMGVEYSWLSVLYGVFVISALSRLTVALLFLPRIREVRPVRQVSARLVFRVARFNPISGLIFDIVGAIRRGRN